MKLERFAYFLAVAQTGSITLGAQKSFITQTAMSQQMAALEAELGLPLLKRSKSGTSLTEARRGRRLCRWRSGWFSAIRR